MAVLGTKKFWKPSEGKPITQKENQILKNTGYINIQLYTVNYMSVGNFWQKTFGGKDKIALTTNLKYRTGVDTIDVASVQNVRQVKSNENYNLALQKNIAAKIPAIADSIEIEVKMTAIEEDTLQAKFDMLNQPEYQTALELAPIIVGQVITVASLVKKLLTDSDPKNQLEASFAAIISAQAEANPINNGKLTQGKLILISTNDGDQFNNVDESKFEFKGDTLYYNNRQVENTYIVLNITFDPIKGEDQTSIWFKKYTDSLNNLDKIYLTNDAKEIEKIYHDSKALWTEGNALIDADPTYVNSEKLKLKSLALKAVTDKYQEITKPLPQITEAKPITAEMLNSITGSTSFNIVKAALPATGSFLNANLKIDDKKPLSEYIGTIADENKIFSFIKTDSESYLSDLKKEGLGSFLGEF